MSISSGPLALTMCVTFKAEPPPPLDDAVMNVHPLTVTMTRAGSGWRRHPTAGR